MSERFVTLDWGFIRDKGTTMQEKLILAEIESLSSLEKGCIASNEHFSQLLGIKKQNVSRSVNALKDKGFIRVEIIKGSRNHDRRITLIKMISEGNQNDTSPNQNDSEGLSKRLETKENTPVNNPVNSKDKQAPAKKSGFDFSILPPSISKEDALNFIEHRKLMKKPLTQRAFALAMQNFCNVASELGIHHFQSADGITRSPAEQIIDYTIEAGWQSVKADWVRNRESSNQHQASSNGQRYPAPLTADDLSGEW